MEILRQLIVDHGLWFVFLAVLLDQGGLPLPAWPPLVIASAVAAEAGTPLWPILLVATAAALLADGAWYLGGRRFGGGLIRLMCRVSLSPDSCVSATRETYSKWGAPSLLVSKFVPGFAAIGTVLAGSSRTPFGRFALFDGLGAALWAGVAVALGATFHDQIHRVLESVEAFGRLGLVGVLGMLALFIAWKALRRHYLIRQARMERISAAELQTLVGQGRHTLVLDARPSAIRLASDGIPGALPVASIGELMPLEYQEVVVYCDCPNEMSAARIARRLKQRGFSRVRPLAGGLEAWRAQESRLATEH